MAVTSITTTSISLSWSVTSGTVDHWEVVWRETDENEGSNTSGRITVTYYTIHHLKTNTSYSITVRATNVISTTESVLVIFILSTTYSTPLPSAAPSQPSNMDANCSKIDNAIAIGVGGGALLFVLIISLSVIVIAVMVFKRKCQADSSASAENRHV